MNRIGYRPGISCAWLCCAVFLLLCQGLATAAAKEPTAEISLPDVNWALVMLPGKVSILEAKQLPGFKGRKLVFGNREQGFLISAFLLPADQAQPPDYYRDEALQHHRQLPFELSDIQQYERNGMAYHEYTVREAQGQPVMQKNVFVYMVRDGYTIDVHVSKVSYSEQDTEWLKALVDSIHIEDNYTHDSLSNFSYASYFYQAKDFRKAATFYNMALKQEEQRRHLSETEWLVMVDNLGMALGLSGELDRAREVFRYGLSKRPQYPMFYYNLACVEAESGNLDATLANLDKVHEFRGNMIPGEQLPDPASDTSFTKYHAEPRFLTAIEKWKQ